ncbi:hypothetical protein CK203_094224 [Vitis vinifera]|uniref:Uncharacterized protein n=1 Tax=Vitis vinifera TaxID=29760 RepID=A0A438DR37_VITVI|nr:hypothetical protein CK203_094224 [Vitis vinifera]
MGSDVVFSSLYLDRSDSVVFGLPGSFMDPHGLARPSLTGCSSRRGHDRLSYGASEIHTAGSALLDTWIPSCLSTWEGHISVRMRFTDHEEVACLALFGEISPLVYMIIHGYEIHAGSMFDLILSGYSEEPLLSHSARFIPFDIVGWGYVECLDPHVIISVRYTSGLLCIPMVLFSGHQGRSVVHRSRLVEPLLAIYSSLRFAAACHTGAYFPHIVSLQSGVQSRRSFTVYDIQSHHVTFFKPSSLLLSVSAFRVVIGFQIDVQSRVLVSAFRVVITSQFDVQKSLSLLSLTFRVIIITSQFRRSELSSIFRSTFRVISSASAFGVVITSQFDVQSRHHHFSVSAFRAIIGFQIDIQSRILGFGVQSRYHFSSFYFLSSVSRVGLVIQGHNSWRSYPLALRILPSGSCIRPRFSSLRYPVLIAYSSRTLGWFDSYSSLTWSFESFLEIS